MFVWEESLSVGNEALDVQHRVFLENVNKFDAEQTDELLQFLVDYARQHFIEEERYMAEHRYPELEAHMRLHAGFDGQLITYVTEFRETGKTPAMATSLVQFMGNWFVSHIRSADQEYKRYIEGGKQ